jgi:hypothetical protein
MGFDVFPVRMARLAAKMREQIDVDPDRPMFWASKRELEQFGVADLAVDAAEAGPFGVMLSPRQVTAIAAHLEPMKRGAA